MATATRRVKKKSRVVVLRGIMHSLKQGEEMPTKQQPLIRPNPLTGGWSCITRYKDHGRHIEAIEKFDVTDQINEIIQLTITAAKKQLALKKKEKK